MARRSFDRRYYVFANRRQPGRRHEFILDTSIVVCSWARDSSGQLRVQIFGDEL
jgi:hypothetical protein